MRAELTNLFLRRRRTQGTIMKIISMLSSLGPRFFESEVFAP